MIAYRDRMNDYWADRLPEGLSLVRVPDKITVRVALLSFLLCLAYLLYECLFGNGSVFSTLPVMGIPFAVCGILYFLRSVYWVPVAVAVICLALWFVDGIPNEIAVFAALFALGIPGAMSLTEAVQRYLFYAVIDSAEQSNIKKIHTIRDKIVIFLFSIPEDMDTREISADCESLRAGIPWDQIKEFVLMGMIAGIAIWIYLMFDPMFAESGPTYQTLPFILTLALYVQMMSSPFCIFRSLNVRVDTPYRAFRLYGGYRSTSVKMALPVLAIMSLLLIVDVAEGSGELLGNLVVSAAVAIAVLIFSAVVYFSLFESSVINDVSSKWKQFHPVQVFVGLDETETKGMEEDVPGTPVRNKDEF